LNFFPSQIAWKQKLFHKEYCCWGTQFFFSLLHL
jgi:hypothetical protein